MGGRRGLSGDPAAQGPDRSAGGALRTGKSGDGAGMWKRNAAGLVPLTTRSRWLHEAEMSRDGSLRRPCPRPRRGTVLDYSHR